MIVTNARLHSFKQPLIPDFSDPLALLVHCHTKIETQLRAMERAVELLRVGAAESRELAFAAIDAASRHFAVPGLKHTEDEELSLFPRLRERSSDAAMEALAAAAALEDEHRTAEALHGEFDALVLLTPRDGSADLKQVDRLGELTAHLAALYRPHIRVENEIVFPAAARVLTPHELSSLGAEMRERRRHLLQLDNKS